MSFVKNMSLQVYIATLCFVYGVIAAEYGLQEASLENSLHQEEDFDGGYDHGEVSSLGHGFHNNEGGDFRFDDGLEDHGISFPGSELTQDISGGGNSYTLDDSSSSLGDHSGLNSFADGHATSYVSIKQHPGKSESYSVQHTRGSSGIAGIYDSSHKYVHGSDNGISSVSYKDYSGKGTSYTVQQSHGQYGTASITSQSDYGKDHMQTIVNGQQSQGHDFHANELSHSIH